MASHVIHRFMVFLYAVLRQADRDDCWGRAAELAFQLMFALFQGLLFMVAVLSILGANPEVFNSIVYFLGSFLPYELYSVIRGQIVEMAAGHPKGFLFLGALGTIWTMSTVMLTLNKSFQRAYHLRETRSFWMLRLVALIVAVVATFMMALVMTLMFFGLLVAHFLESNIGYANQLSMLIRVLRVPLALMVTTLLGSMLYRSLLSLKQSMMEALPGAIFFCVLWFCFTYVFGIYLRNFSLYNKTYGTLGVFLILMLWMYLTSLSMLLGGELNAEIHRRYEHDLRLQARQASQEPAVLD
jgi:membrane protein